MLAAPRDLATHTRAPIVQDFRASALSVPELRRVSLYTVTPTIGCSASDSRFRPHIDNNTFVEAHTTRLPDSVIMAAVGSMVASV